MKKLVTGMAAFCASAVSFAQIATEAPAMPASSVKVYGVADLALVHYRTSGESLTAMHTGGSGSRIGFLMGEQLGGGWRVGARLEAGVNLDTGTSSSTSGNPNRTWSRQAYVELANQSFGALRLGRQQGPTYGFFGMFDPMLLPPMDSWGVLTTLGAPLPGMPSHTGVSTGFMINPTFRTENTVAYISPRMRGLLAQVSYSLNEGSRTQPALLEAAVDYESGPLTLGLLFVRAASTAGAGTVAATDAVSEAAIGAKYQAGPIQPYLTYIRRNQTDPTLGAGGNVLNGRAETVKLVGAVVPVAERVNLRMTYGRYASGTVDRDAISYGLGLTYEPTRSLMLMVAYTHLAQGRAATWPVFQSPKARAGEPVEGLATGLTWRF